MLAESSRVVSSLAHSIAFCSFYSVLLCPHRLEEMFLHGRVSDSCSQFRIAKNQRLVHLVLDDVPFVLHAHYWTFLENDLVEVLHPTWWQ